MMAIPPFQWPGSKKSTPAAPTPAAKPVAVSKPAAAPAKPAGGLFNFGGNKAFAKSSANAPSSSEAAPARNTRGVTKIQTKIPGKNDVDMTWGGRPDPAPEAYVDESSDFWGFAKRLGGKKN